MAPLFPSTLDEYRKEFSGVSVTNNFEQVLGMVRQGEVDRLAIIMGATFSSFDAYYGQTMAERIHLESPDLPILIYQGRRQDWIESKKSLVWAPIKYPNETYFRIQDYTAEEAVEIIREFFSKGKLSLTKYATSQSDNTYT